MYHGTAPSIDLICKKEAVHKDRLFTMVITKGYIHTYIYIYIYIYEISDCYIVVREHSQITSSICSNLKYFDLSFKYFDTLKGILKDCFCSYYSDLLLVL